MKKARAIRLPCFWAAMTLFIPACGGAGDGGGDEHVAADGGSSATGGQLTAAGGTSGGTSSGGSSTGGQSTGGAATGGTPIGGASTGGQSTGGAANGGTSTGGASTGGQATGGSATGGTSSSDGYPLGNPPVKSAGCGKSPGLSAGTHSMTSAGLDREYILELPDNYDSNKPYRLVFGMHWWGGSAEAVQGWSKWFGLKALDTEDSTIWVAPQGYTDGSPWRGKDDRDHTYFDDLYSKLASALCVDTSRVFSAGFSFGAMYTNSLAQTHQDVLRGVVVYAAADYNIYFPKNTGKPLAYMGVHGLKDPTCPIPSGRQSRDRFVENNGCTAPSTVPEASPKGSQVTYDYDCPSNYPVRWTTFDGAHTYPPNNDGAWVHPLTWEFISQF
jgi:poly(3-hydroxybutyrate) depolymerase